MLSGFELYPRWVPLRTGIRYIVNNSLTVWTLFYGMLLLWNPVAMNRVYLGKNNL